MLEWTADSRKPFEPSISSINATRTKDRILREKIFLNIMKTWKNGTDAFQILQDNMFHHYLKHFSPMFLFYTPWKVQNTTFLTFSGGIEMSIRYSLTRTLTYTWYDCGEWWSKLWHIHVLSSKKQYHIKKRCSLQNLIQMASLKQYVQLPSVLGSS